jgi:uroporphyrinogen-III synthase
LGAEFDPVLPYRYQSDEHDDEVASMILEMMNGRVDLIAFTSKLQVQRLLEVAERKGLATQLKHSLNAITIAAVGPVAATAVEEAGGTVQVQPASSFHLKPLVREIVRAFGRIG